MSADGNRIATGAGYDDDNGDDWGHVRIYDLIESTWTRVGDDIDGEAAGNYSGVCAAMSADGHRVAIRADCNTILTVKQLLTNVATWLPCRLTGIELPLVPGMTTIMETTGDTFASTI